LTLSIIEEGAGRGLKFHYIIPQIGNIVKEIQTRISTGGAEPSRDGKDDGGVFCELGGEILEKAEDNRAAGLFLGLEF